MKFNIHNYTRGIALALTLGYSVAVFADSFPKVEILGKEYYVYASKKGETLFGIARANNWDLATLNSLNPKAVSPLQKGTKIYYPVSEEATSQSSLPSTVSKPVSKPLTHRVKLGETVYGISKMYSVSEGEIYRLNPNSKKGIREGEILKISETPTVSNAESDSSEIYYTVKKGDTLFKVAKEHSTSVACIMKENPGVNENNFQAGSIIRLPEKGAGLKKVTKQIKEEKLTSFDTYTVDKSDTWETIAAKTGTTKDDLIRANSNSGEKPKRKSIIAIPRIDTIVSEKVVLESDPREMTKEGLADIYEDVHNLTVVDSLQEINVALFLSEPTSKKDIEFTRGLLTSINGMKNSGIRIKLAVLDGTKNSTEILSEVSEINPNVIVLTNDKGIPGWLAEYAEVSQTPMVNTFDIKNELYTENPYMVQLLTPSNYFNDKVAKYLSDNYSSHTLLYVGTPDTSDQFATALSDLWGKRPSLTISIDEFKNMEVKDDMKYLIYAYPTKKEEISELLSAVIDRKGMAPLSDIKVFGRPNWIMYDESLIGKFHEADVMIPSRFFYDKDAEQSKIFEDGYKNLFNNSPYKSFPMYAALGYDAANYFIKGLVKGNMDPNALGTSSGGVQSEFEIVRPTNWSGMLNNVVYVIRFTPYSTIEKLLVR